MKPYEGAVDWVLLKFFGILCRLDIAELNNVPSQGPFILVGNHVNFLEVPVIRAGLYPRDVIGLAKAEAYDNPLTNFLFKTWGSISIERGTVDRTALKACSLALAQGKILAVAPEGTRSGDGNLLPGKPGITLIAVHSGVSLVPVSYWGAEQFWDNLKHFRRTPFHVRVGRPFVIDTHGEGLSKEMRQRITDEIMFKLAELLPEQYRGAYPHPEREVYQYLREL
ncbi:MAG: lysophospholipid acyltransferase family protein [Omnitrophica WOR_2 bacterium]